MAALSRRVGRVEVRTFQVFNGNCGAWSSSHFTPNLLLNMLEKGTLSLHDSLQIWRIFFL